MPVQVSESFEQIIVDATRDAFLTLLNNPACWSDQMVQKTMHRLGSTAYNIQDVQMIIKDYLSVLSEAIRKGEAL
ncbi:MAG: hypothetical protein ACE14T_08400 [Syntrophales bacterium]